jgi:hypothetical protein
MSEFFYRIERAATPRRAKKVSGPPERRGIAVRGRVAKLFFGQGHGYIRLANGREVYFHRADMMEGTAFNDLRVSTRVTCELWEDTVSGARALRVAKHTRPR